MKKFLLIPAMIFIVCFSAFGQEYSLTEGQEAFLQKLVNQGYLKLKPELNTAYIDPSLWRDMNIDLKTDVAFVLAVYCTNYKGSSTYWVEIFDLYSGKKLAKFSETWGLKIAK